MSPETERALEDLDAFFGRRRTAFEAKLNLSIARVQRRTKAVYLQVGHDEWITRGRIAGYCGRSRLSNGGD